MLKALKIIANSFNDGTIVGLFVLSLTISIFTGMAMWTDRTLEFWLSQYAKKPVEIHLFWDFMINMLAAPVMLFANVISEIARAAIGG